MLVVFCSFVLWLARWRTIDRLSLFDWWCNISLLLSSFICSVVVDCGQWLKTLKEGLKLCLLSLLLLSKLKFGIPFLLQMFLFLLFIVFHYVFPIIVHFLSLFVTDRPLSSSRKHEERDEWSRLAQVINREKKVVGGEWREEKIEADVIVEIQLIIEISDFSYQFISLHVCCCYMWCLPLSCHQNVIIINSNHYTSISTKQI